MESKELEMALAVIRESENLIINLRVSIRSSSPERQLIESGLVQYLRRRKYAYLYKYFLFGIKAFWIKRKHKFLRHSE